MTRARLDGLYFLLIASVMFVLLGAVLEEGSSVHMEDYRAMYFSARCLMQHCDPYREGDVLRVYRAEGGDYPSDSSIDRQIGTRYAYLPTAFCLALPFAMLPWGPAHLLWMALTMGSLILASFLIWNIGADYAPIFSGVLIGFLLANSEVVVVFGNSAGIVVSLCIVAVWCFLRERFVPAGILCLAIGLATKPQDAGVVWLYFLLAGGVYRKRALQALLTAVALSLPGVLWVWHLSPRWIQELHFNILAFSAYGGTNDPRASSMGPKGVLDLQTVISVFRNDPRIYNPASYLICGLLLLAWIFVTVRSRPSRARVWLALAAISALSMLPVYHRQYDAKLLLLTVPACAMLWAEGGKIGRLALLVNAAGLVVTGDLAWVFFVALIRSLHLPATGLPWQILLAALIVAAPITLLVMSVFYLWVYARSGRHPAERGDGVGPAGG